MLARRSLPSFFAVLLPLLLDVASPAAAVLPEARCRATKIRAAGAEARAALACEQRALVSGSAGSCTELVATRRARVFARADATGGCAATGDSADLGGAVSTLRGELLSMLRPNGPAASRCTSLQLAAAAAAVGTLAQAHARDLRTPDVVRLAADVAVVAQKLDGVFARAATRGDCLSSATSAAVGALLEGAVAGFRALLFERCGNRVVEAGEICDAATLVPAGLGEADGCSAPGSPDECGLCADRSPCHVRGLVPSPVTMPCCSGTCVIPGPEAGANAVAFCNAPPPDVGCPCWTRDLLDQRFPPGSFDQGGRGGALCAVRTSADAGFGANDTCTFFSSTPLQLNRGGAFVFSELCLLLDDRDPSNTGVCNGGASAVAQLSVPQSVACVAEILASQAYAASCAP